MADLIAKCIRTARRTCRIPSAYPVRHVKSCEEAGSTQAVVLFDKLVRKAIEEAINAMLDEAADGLSAPYERTDERTA